MSAITLRLRDRAGELTVRGIEEREGDFDAVAHDHGGDLLLYVVDYGLWGCVDEDWVGAEGIALV
jgi:hypothetical protein